MSFEYRDHDGDSLHVAPLGAPEERLIGLAIETTAAICAVHVPLDRVEEVVAGIRDAARTAAARQTTGQAGTEPGNCPNCDHPFLLNGCTCRPWTTRGGVPRWCTGADTVDMISGYERGADCPHHRPATAEEPDPTTAEQLLNLVDRAERGLTPDEAARLRNGIEQLVDELAGRDDAARERWIQKQLDETGVKALDFRNGMAMEIEPARELVAHWVGAARAMLGDAPNYTETPIEMEVKVGESPERFAFVLQRVGKLTPHQARQQAEQRAELAEADRDGWRERAQGYKAAVEQVRALASQWAILRAYGSAATELRAALDATAPAAASVHIGNGANAEDCPACSGTNPPYPFICPGPKDA